MKHDSADVTDIMVSYETFNFSSTVLDAFCNVFRRLSKRYAYVRSVRSNKTSCVSRGPRLLVLLFCGRAELLMAGIHSMPCSLSGVHAAEFAAYIV